MYAIASLLDPISGQAVQQFWERFEKDCGLTGVKLWPLPHFSWLSAEMFQLEPVEQVVRAVSQSIRPFHICAGSVGVFPGSRPVVYLGLVKNEALLRIHQLLWDRLLPFIEAPNLYYSPENWIPHITLALYDVEPDRLACAINSIAFEKIEMEIAVDNFVLLTEADLKSGIKNRFAFREEILSLGEN